jgi:hypothetical protein
MAQMVAVFDWKRFNLSQSVLEFHPAAAENLARAGIQSQMRLQRL